MKLKQLTVKQSLNKAYRLIKPERPDIEKFKSNFKLLLGHINPQESEENMKGHIMDFLKNTWYSPNYHIATKGRTDFVIHTGKDANHPAGVLFEAKKPSNHEMVTLSNLNTKAMHEIMLYYLRERIEHQNSDIQYLVITNIYEWFVFDAPVFERLFYKNSALIKEYKAWVAKQKVSTNNDLFYNEIAKPFLASLTEEIEFTYFDIREYEKPLKDSDKNNDNKLIPLFKILSPTHLLKLPFSNDSNTLDKGFYNELLYIIGLEEVKEGSKKLIRRRQEGKRLDGSLLENTIDQLETENCLHKVSDLQSYGETTQEQLFSVALELCITWINRILFLKLLEAQLLKYHKGNENYRFLNYKTISQYDELYKLFFQVLARKQQERIERARAKYKHIPYLNSSLFEITPLEEQTIRINMLDDAAEMPLLNSTVLRDEKNKPVAQKLNTLQYLFDFLNAYDFASEGSEEIQEERKTLINASVLGLIFEKINGYKDGSIFTPGFITMYMCRQSIRQAVVSKFKDKYNWKAETFEDLHNYVSDDRSAKAIKEYNAQINSLTICDPAVGSGHFLVSALNELIAIKSELGILADANGKRLSDHTATVENDELLVTDRERNFFAYYVNDANEHITIPNAEVQRVQETLFHEKQSLIENSLFGVDINPKSVQICRLRLWIELLKNAYYIADGSNSNGELQTLPNIDINIKTGNSLISRFGLEEDLKAATPYFEKKILEYKSWVADYKHEVDKDKKRGIQQLMSDLKKGFLSKVTDRNPTKIKLDKITKEFLQKYVNEKLFTQNLTAAQKKDKERLENEIEKFNKDLEAYVKSPVYNNAFEWRFEFPEVLDKEGNFIGFDVVIGNPPYGVKFENSKLDYFKNNYQSLGKAKDSYVLFIELANKISKINGLISFIVPTGWYTGTNFGTMRKYFAQNTNPILFTNLPYDVFDEAWVDTSIFVTQKREEILVWPRIDSHQLIIKLFDKKDKIESIESFHKDVTRIAFTDWFISGHDQFLLLKDNSIAKLINKIKEHSKDLSNYADVQRGVTPFHLSPEPTHENSTPAFNGTVRRYKLELGPIRYIQYDTTLAEFKPERYFQGQRILLRELISRQFELQAVQTSEHFVTNKSMQSIIATSEYSSNYLLAFINSHLMSWYFLNISQIAQRDDFPKIVLKETRQLPIFPIDLKNESQLKLYNEINTIVDKILDAKKDSIHTDTSVWEKEIDQLIYQLYGLLEEEINIVEGSFKNKGAMVE